MRLFYLGAVPICIHAGINLFFGLEAESSAVVLFGCMASASVVGGFLGIKNFGLIESTLAAAWPSWLAGWRHWHWSLDMPAPGGAAQAFVGFLGWREASMPAALGAVLAASGAAGWSLMRFDRLYKRKKG